MLPFQRLALQIHSFAALIALVLADPNDWVNVDYVISQAKVEGRSPTADARAAIIRNAQSSAGKGPWTVTSVKDILPPSKDPHDYLSWAPYHWPNCNWCSKAGRTHLAHTSLGSGHNDSAPSTSASSVLNPDDAYENEAVLNLSHRRPRRRSHSHTQALLPLMDIGIEQGQNVIPTSVPDLPVQNTATASSLSATAIPSILPVKFSALSPPAPTSTSQSRGHGPAQAAAKTTAKTSKTSCVPSPTISLAPSATWTTCPYVARDGQVNPDVRTLNGPDAINDVAQAVLYSAVAFALTRTSIYSVNVAKWIKGFFLDSATKMNPNMNFGQIVRGPGLDGVSGTFTGILDLRGLVKIANAVAIIKAANSPDWTPGQDQQMRSWSLDYSDWLMTSPIGMKTATRPNNHATFYVSQVVATKILSGDRPGAATALQDFFAGIFLDQVAKSGEQPFEAVRTRPFHYRSFNLEALITNAKLGDQLGLNLWAAKSKYGATIQTALDFAMALDPRDEDVSQIFPHVAAVAAAYGDPAGKYAAFLKKREPTYQSKSYWFYDQSSALPNAPAKNTRRVIWQREDFSQINGSDPIANVPFECPAVFRDEASVEIDNGVYVTCEELEPYFTEGKVEITLSATLFA
ncbi:chondroitin AC/alginate lyase [Pholiota conissans]|uniref:Chondroitin AC/alginate lyase n=1 Tax=Pholiota conissans TaxID=109636 RepID=A0A9P6CU44_9AGAR|nr:chondroitin AC/alginate lyase [Pholiota conissans]